MDHNEIKTKLSDFYDDETPPTEKDEISSHLRSCSECQADIAAWRDTSTALFFPSSKVSTEAFVSNVMSRLKKKESFEFSLERQPRSRFLEWLFPSFVGVALAGIAFLFVIPLQSELASSETLVFETPNEKGAAALYSLPADDEAHVLDSLVGGL